MKTTPASRVLKFILAALAIILGGVSAAPSVQAQVQTKSAEGHEYMIQQGKVMQVIKEGLLVVDPYGPIDTSTGPQGMPTPTIILLTGYPDAVVDGDPISWPCIMKLTGTFQYTTTEGAIKTIRKFAFVHKGNK